MEADTGVSGQRSDNACKEALIGHGAKGPAMRQRMTGGIHEPNQNPQRCGELRLGLREHLKEDAFPESDSETIDESLGFGRQAHFCVVTTAHQ